MAGDWHPIFNNLRDSPRVVRMARDLKCKRTLIVGACSIWWAILDDHGSNGLVPGYGLEELDDVVQVKGFGDAMVSVGWIQVVEAGLFAPEWEKHNSHGAKVRLTERSKKRRQRSAAQCPAPVPEVSRNSGTKSGQNGDTTGTTTTTTTTTITTKDKKTGAAPPLGVFPKALDTPAFREAWADWKDDRKANRRKPLTPKGEAIKLAELASWGEADAIAGIKASIGNGWQGIFRPGGSEATPTAGPDKFGCYDPLNFPEKSDDEVCSLMEYIYPDTFVRQPSPGGLANVKSAS
jgi:hypothetical protein